MKKTVQTIIVLSVILVSACSKPGKDVVNITGQWELTDVTLTTKSAQIGDQKINVYLDFLTDGTYEMYQMFGQGRYMFYEGNWTLNSGVLSGTYKLSKKIQEWGNVYNVSVDGNVLKLTATINSSDIHVYQKSTIPEEVKAGALKK